MLAKLKQHLLRIHRDDRGAMTIEMVLILLIVAVPVLIALYLFITWLINKWNEKSNDLKTDIG